MPLFDEKGERIRGEENKEAAERARARLKLSGHGWTGEPPVDDGCR